MREWHSPHKESHFPSTLAVSFSHKPVLKFTVLILMLQEYFLFKNFMVTLMYFYAG
jgi:hypothetical protein